MKILAIETSCDETAAAVIEERDKAPAVLSNIVSSQINIHKKYGGVVPEVAARAHIENILPVVIESLNIAQSNISDLNYIGITTGPGLIGSLVVGVETAKALSLALKIPLIPINHLEGHIYAAFDNKKPEFPILTLLVSGGNTLLILMKNHLCYEVIGQTRDDAAGEAFDKAAKLLGLHYPGGPAISKAATAGDENKYKFPLIDLTPKPYRNKKGFLQKPETSLDFSFSGLKTALLVKVKAEVPLKKKQINDLAASFQKAIVNNLVKNSLIAIKKYRPKTFVLSGGVAANELLRETLKQKIAKDFSDTVFITPEFKLCTDNAAMIGIATYYKIIKDHYKKQTIIPQPNQKLFSDD